MNQGIWVSTILIKKYIQNQHWEYTPVMRVTLQMHKNLRLTQSVCIPCEIWTYNTCRRGKRRDDRLNQYANRAVDWKILQTLV